MFGLFRRTSKDTESNTIAGESLANTGSVQDSPSDSRLIAVIMAAVARFREAEGIGSAEAGFVVRRVRRI